MNERPEISVLIPSRNNRDRLRRTLESIAACRFDLARVEVLVCDDGSDDGTYESLEGSEWPFGFRIVRGEFGNQSAATNAVAELARGRYLLCSASDLIFDPEIFDRHLATHARFPDEHVGVLGYLPYTPEIAGRPFMHFLMHGGPQFAYGTIHDIYNLPATYCYAPNFSVEREVFERVGAFDPFFRYGGQDTDLGYRLVAAGVRLAYCAEAIAWHDHEMTVETYRKRQEAAGISSVLLGIRYPEVEDTQLIWNMAINHYLAYPELMLDRDEALVRRFEPEVARDPEYRDAWEQAQEGGSSDSCQRVGRLFGAYERIVTYHWGKAFFEETLRRHGRDRVRERVVQRFRCSQTTLQYRRVAQEKLRELGVELTLLGEREAIDSLVIHGIRDEGEAIEALSPFFAPRKGVFNRELLLVLPAALRGSVAAKKIGQVARVTHAVDEALRAATGDFVTVRAADVTESNPRARWIAKQLFERIDRLEVISGGVHDPANGRVTIGSAPDGSPLSVDRPTAEGAGVQPIDLPGSDYFVVRRRLADRLTGDEIREIGEAVKQAGGLTCYVQAIQGARLSGGVAGHGETTWNAS